MSNKDDHAPAKIQQRDKRKLKEDEGNTGLSKRKSESTDGDHTNEPTIIKPLPLKYTKVSILPAHLKLRKKKTR